MKPATQAQTSHRAQEVERQSELIVCRRRCGCRVSSDPGESGEVSREEVQRDKECEEECAEGVCVNVDWVSLSKGPGRGSRADRSRCADLA